MSDPSVPWLVAAYAVAFVLFSGYVLRLVVARRRLSRGGPVRPSDRLADRLADRPENTGRPD